MTTRTAKLKVVLQGVINLGILALATYVDEFRELPSIVQITVLILVAILLTSTGNALDYLREKAANIEMRAEAQKLKLGNTVTRRELDELKQVVAEFLEHSEIYRERVKDQLKLTEDYLCIAKSSEGLSAVWNSLVEKVRTPFTTVLMRIPGTVKPFENMAFFFVPLASLRGMNEWNIREYIGREFIPEVKRERLRFLRRPRTDATAKADKFSYKYMAFLIKKGSIVYDVRNRKFNREFNAFIVDEQVGGSFRRIKRELANLVKTKDLLALANWASFADLNRAQKAFVEKNRGIMSAELSDQNIGNLADIAGLTAAQLLEALWPVLRHRISRRKALNICKKVTSGAQHTVQVLERSGVKL